MAKVGCPKWGVSLSGMVYHLCPFFLGKLPDTYTEFDLSIVLDLLI